MRTYATRHDERILVVPPESVDDARRRLDEAIAYVRRGELVPAEVAGGSPFGAGALARIVQGGDDTSVPTHHGEALRDARGDGGTYLLVPGVSHMYKIVPPEVTLAAAFGYLGPTDLRGGGWDR